MSNKNQEATNLEVAKSIFAFLKDMLKLRNKPIKNLDYYNSQQQLFAYPLQLDPDVKASQSFFLSTNGENIPKYSIMTLPKINPTLPPEPSEQLSPWISGDIQDPESELSLFNFSVVRDFNEVDIEFQEEMSREDMPDIEEEFEFYKLTWSDWATKNSKDSKLYAKYAKLHKGKTMVDGMSYAVELVLGLGNLITRNNNSTPVLNRHLFYVECSFELKARTGTIHIKIDESPFYFEDDWIQGFEKPSKALLEETLEKLNAVLLDELDSEVGLNEFESMLPKFETIVSDFANQYRSDLVTDSESVDFEKSYSLTANPYLIFRFKSQRHIIQVLEEFEELFDAGKPIPAPLLALIEPGIGELESSRNWSSDGAAVNIDSEVYLPLSLNQKQTKALESSDRKNATVIQGPPGTGKTRTIATMASHFLARGERVLVVSETAQALREVHSQIPEEIRDLAVSIFGNSKEDRDIFYRSISALNEASENRDQYQEDFAEKEAVIENEILVLHQSKMALYDKITQLREIETEKIVIDGLQSSRAYFASKHLEESSEYYWLDEISDYKAPALEISPAIQEDIIRKIRMFWAIENPVSLSLKLPKSEELLNQEVLTELCELKLLTSSKNKKLKLSIELANELTKLIDSALVHEKILLEATNQPWAQTTHSDLMSKRKKTTISRIEKAGEILQGLDGVLYQIGDLSSIVAGPTSMNLIPILENLEKYALANGSFKLDSVGCIKKSLVSKTTTKQAHTVLNDFKIKGKSPSTKDEIGRVINLVKFDAYIVDIISVLNISHNDVPISRLEKSLWLAELRELVESSAKLDELVVDIKSLLTSNTVTDQSVIGPLLNLNVLYDIVRSVTATYRIKELRKDINFNIENISKYLDSTKTDLEVKSYLEFLEKEDELNFTIARERLITLIDNQSLKNTFITAVESAYPSDQKFTSSILTWIDLTDQPDQNKVLGMALRLSEAFKWKNRGQTIGINTSVEYQELFESILSTHKLIESKVRLLARQRAWRKALNRISPSTLSNMARFALEVRKLGAGKGKTANRRKKFIKELLEKCVTAIPAWIMPIDEVAKQFPATLELFDVIIVDESSQARLDALFLLAMTKSIVIVGDDRQVSPEGGMLSDIDVQEIVNRNLKDSARKANWSNTNLSLFDETKAAFGNVITLTEHRRCVPEIIEFSNIIAYKGDNIKLVPVRQTGSANIKPIINVHLPNALARKKGNSYENPTEAMFIATEIGKMVKNPSFKGKTIGVVTLLGQTQQDLITRYVNFEIQPSDWDERKLKIGTPPDFQGAERDIIFLSLVATPLFNHAPLTIGTMVQRFNVAVSRAKDQLIVVHSIKANEIKNDNCLRKRLLKYTYSVESDYDSKTFEPSTLVSEITLEEGFNSIFQQKVHNAIASKGYRLLKNYTPQIEGNAITLDLVVVGPYGKFAVMCDGEKWAGSTDFKKELRSQEILASTGWEFFRVTESKFYSDAHSLDTLWERLEQLSLAQENSNTQGNLSDSGSQLDNALMMERLAIIDTSTKRKVRKKKT